MELGCTERGPKPKRDLRGFACVVVLACCGWSTGCHRKVTVAPEEQVRAALNTFYAAQPACLWAKPVTLKETRGAASISSKEAHALDDAGLIDRERHGYTLTNAGQPFWRATATEPGYGNLCFGKWHVDHVDHVTVRKDDLLGTMADTTFEASMPSPALWTRLPEIQKAFPGMTEKLTEQAPHSATMRHTDKGWQVAVIAAP